MSFHEGVRFDHSERVSGEHSAAVFHELLPDLDMKSFVLCRALIQNFLMKLDEVSENDFLNQQHWAVGRTALFGQLFPGPGLDGENRTRELIDRWNRADQAGRTALLLDIQGEMDVRLGHFQPLSSDARAA